jgi:hypothetical protein
MNGERIRGDDPRSEISTAIPFQNTAGNQAPPYHRGTQDLAESTH